MTKTQAATLTRMTELCKATGSLDVTYGGIKGVNRTAMWSLNDADLINIECTYEGEGDYRRCVKMVATIA